MKTISTLTSYLYYHHFFDLLFITRFFRNKLQFETQTEEINFYLDPTKDYIQNLTAGLDTESVQTVQNSVKYLKYCTTADKLTNINEYFDNADKDLYQELNKKREKYLQEYNIGLLYEVLNTGLHQFPLEELRGRLAGKDLLDCGAYIGDSSLVLSKEFTSLNKIYAFEPNIENFQTLQDNMVAWKLQNVVPVNAGVSDENKTIGFINDKLSSRIDESATNKIDLLKIDDFAEKNNLNVGVIKMDIEGEEYHALQGAMNTIKSSKPILLIAIYHNGKDYFELKPYLENLNLGYKFMIRKLTPISPLAETFLIAY